MGSEHITAPLLFTERGQEFEQEKPYTVHHSVLGWEGNVPRTNLRSTEAVAVAIKDLRGRESQFSFRKNGFAVLEMDSKLAYEDFEDRTKVEEVYCQELASSLLAYFNAQAVQFSDIEVDTHSLTQAGSLSSCC